MDNFKRFAQAAQRAAEKENKNFRHESEPVWLKHILTRLNIPQCDTLFLLSKDKRVVADPSLLSNTVEEILAQAEKGRRGGRVGEYVYDCTQHADRKVMLVLSDSQPAMDEWFERNKPKNNAKYHDGIRIQWLKEVMESRTTKKQMGIVSITMNRGGGFSEEKLQRACADLQIQYCD